jgi:hypothetical protein
MKTELEVRAKLKEMLQFDAIRGINGGPNPAFIGAKVGACKALLWALGENDDDRWHITAAPGEPVDTRVRNRN